MKLKQQKLGVGRARLIKWIVISLMSLLLFMNISISITKPYPILKSLTITLPYLTIIIMGLFFSFDLFLTTTFLIVALISAIDQTAHVDYSGSIFFFLSYCIHKNNKYGIFVILITILSISIRSYINDFSIFQAFNLTLAYAAVYSISYIMLIKKPKKLTGMDYADITEEEKAIVKLYCNGYNYEQISKTLGVNNSESTIRRKIKKVKDRLHCKNDAQLGNKLNRNV